MRWQASRRVSSSDALAAATARSSCASISAGSLSVSGSNSRGILPRSNALRAFAGAAELAADFAYGFHVGFYFNAELFLAEEVDEFDCGCGRASSEPPDVGVEDVDAVDDCHYARRKAIAGCAVGMEVHGNFYRGFEFAYDGGGAQRVDKACHILQG